MTLHTEHIEVKLYKFWWCGGGAFGLSHSSLLQTAFNHLCISPIPFYISFIFLLPSSHSTFHTPSTTTDVPRLFACVMIALLILPTLNYRPVRSMNFRLTNRNFSYLRSDVTWFRHDIQFVCPYRKLNN